MASLVLPRQTKPPSGLQMNFLNISNPINKPSRTFPLQLAAIPLCFSFTSYKFPVYRASNFPRATCRMGSATHLSVKTRPLEMALTFFSLESSSLEPFPSSMITVMFEGYLQKILAEVRVAAAGCISPRTASPPLGMHITPTPPWLRLVPCRRGR